jgi:spore germination cell wall hydrolase CwlJ-like protein
MKNLSKIIYIGVLSVSLLAFTGIVTHSKADGTYKAESDPLLFVVQQYEIGNKYELNSNSLNQLPDRSRYRKEKPKQYEINQEELNCMKRLLFYEARSTSKAEIEKIADVVINRTTSEGFPSTVCGVEKQPKQFSYRNNKAPAKNWDKQVIAKGGLEAEILEVIQEIAKAKLSYGSKYKDLLFYHTKAVAPSWGKSLKKVVFKQHQHVFYARI